jgi:hypothetical protein
MDKSITRSTRPQVVDMAKWRERYESIRNADPGLPVTARHPEPARVLMATESAIEQAVRIYCAKHNLTGPERAASVAAAIRKFRAGNSAATAIRYGYSVADGHAWGSEAKRPFPDGAA